MRYKFITYFVFAVFLSLILSEITSANTVSDSDSLSKVTEKKVLLMPIVNFSGKSQALDMVVPKLINSYREKLGSIYEPDELRDILRKYRIRSSGMITEAHAKKLRADLGVDYIIISSIDLFEQSNIYEVGISHRVIDIVSMRIVCANSVSATNLDYMKIFGIGKINDIETLTDKVISELNKKFSIPNFNWVEIYKEEENTAAIVEFDNNSRFSRAGKVVMNQLITLFFNNNFSILEPGEIYESMIRARSIDRGALNEISIKDLCQHYNVDYFITGTVDEFSFASGGENASPQVQIDLRCIKGKGSKIIYVDNIYKDGAESETIFKLGRCNSLGKLSFRVLNEHYKKFFKEYSDELLSKN